MGGFFSESTGPCEFSEVIPYDELRAWTRLDHAEVHVGYLCDSCDNGPIVGPRFRTVAQGPATSDGKRPSLVCDLCLGCFLRAGAPFNTMFFDEVGSAVDPRED